MRRRIDVEKAGEAESFGALAVGSARKPRRPGASRVGLTPAQIEALCDVASSLLQIAREAGPKRKRVRIGKLSFEMHDNGSEQVLSIRKPIST